MRTVRYCSHSSQTLAVWLRKNVIQVFAGFFCEAKFQISLRKLLFTGLPVNSNNYSAMSDRMHGWIVTRKYEFASGHGKYFPMDRRFCHRLKIWGIFRSAYRSSVTIIGMAAAIWHVSAGTGAASASVRGTVVFWKAASVASIAKQ